MKLIFYVRNSLATVSHCEYCKLLIFAIANRRAAYFPQTITVAVFYQNIVIVIKTIEDLFE